MPNAPEFLYFDLGNVVLLFDHEIACRQMAAVAGIEVDRVRQVVFESGLEWRYERGDVSTAEFYEEFCRETKTSPDLEPLKLAASNIFTLNTPLVPLLCGLKRARLRLGLLSNTCVLHWDFVSPGRYAVIEFFDVYALSFDLRRMKPEPEIYRAAIELAGVPPGRLFFVDDREENVVAARNAGIDAVLFSSVPNLARQLNQRGLKFYW